MRVGHQHDHDERRDGVRTIESGEHDDQPGDRRSDERVEVGHYVHVGAAHVETTAVRFGQDPRSHDVVQSTN